MLSKLSLVFFFFLSVHSATVCNNPDFHELTKDLGGFIFNQTLIIDALADYVENKFAAGLEDKITQFYKNVNNSANLLQYSVKAALATGALDEELKHLNLDKIISKYQVLDNKPKINKPVVDKVLRQYKELFVKIQNPSTSNSNTTCDPLMLFETLVETLNFALVDLDIALDQVYQMFNQFDNPGQILKEDLNIIRLASNTVMTLTQRLAEFKGKPKTLSIIEVSTLKVSRYWAQDIIDSTAKMLHKDIADLTLLQDIFQTIMQNLNKISGDTF